jgi:Tfp pilus assembly protein PilO
LLKISEREKKLILAASALVISFLFLQFLLTPQWNEIAKLKEKARGLRLELRVAEGKIKILNTLEQRGEATPQETVQPKEEKALNLLKALSQATAQSGLELNSINPLLEEKTEGIKFNLSCSGKYQNLYDFLIALYQLRILFVIDMMEVRANQGASPDLDIRITLTAF